MKTLKGILNVKSNSVKRYCKDSKDKYSLIRDTDDLNNDQMDILSHGTSANKRLHELIASGDIGVYIDRILFFALIKS